ncbi:MAG: hypothetical protein R6U40_05205, partial [Desulfobacterales bacterium]
RTMFLGIPFIFSFFVFQSLLQGWGDTRTPLYLMVEKYVFHNRKILNIKMQKQLQAPKNKPAGSSNPVCALRSMQLQ